MAENAARSFPSSEPETFWFIARGSVLKGPFTTSQIEERIKKKEISYLDYCWKQGFHEWRPIASVDALDRRKHLARLPSYPSVEVPHGSRPTLVAVKPEVQNTEPANVRISFSKVHKRSLSIYEWALAVVVAVILAYLSTTFALNTVAENVLQRFQFHRLSVVGTMGENNGALPRETWNPLASAPGFADVVEAGLVSMPVKVLAPLYHDAAGQLRGANGLELPVPSLVEAERTGLDPVFVQSFEVYGEVSPLDFQRIHVDSRGEPWIRRK